MSIFQKKTTNQGMNLPYSLVLAIGLFLLSGLFTLCYANPAYNPASGHDFANSPIWRTSFLTGGLGLLVVLDFGVRYSFNKENKYVPWIYLSLGILESIFILVSTIIYFVHFEGLREGASWAIRIITSIVVLLISGLNIFSRVPKFLDFKNYFENIGHDLIHLSIVGILEIVPVLMLLAVTLEKNERETQIAAIIFTIVFTAVLAIVPFLTTKLIKDKAQTYTFSLAVSVGLTLVYFIFVAVFNGYYKQETYSISYKELYYALFAYGFGTALSLISSAFYGYSLYKIKK